MGTIFWSHLVLLPDFLVMLWCVVVRTFSKGLFCFDIFQNGIYKNGCIFDEEKGIKILGPWFVVVGARYGSCTKTSIHMTRSLEVLQIQRC